jgi:hypothetical protein
MTSERHDAIYAAVSHLPQRIAFALAPLLSPTTEECARHHRFLRLENSNQQVWKDIFTYNAAALDPLLHTFHEHLKQVMQLDAPTLAHAFAHAARKRMALPHILPAPGEETPLDTLTWIVGTAVMETIPDEFLPYAGTGLSDFTAPLCSTPPHTLHLEIWRTVPVNLFP